MDRRPKIPWTPAVVLCLCATGWTVAQEPVLECPYANTGGDLLFRGFYIPEYPADDLDRVELRFATNFTDSYTISLTAREDTYDGPILGVSTLELELVAGTPGPSAGDGADVFLGGIPTVPGVFEFDAVPVTPGSTVTFALEQLGGLGSAYYDVGPCDIGEPGCEELCSGEIVQTTGTVPPLDTYRRASVGIRVYGAPPADVPALGVGAAGLLALLLIVASSRALRR